MSELLFLHYIHMVISFRSSPLVGELGHVQCASAVQSEFAYIFKGATNAHLVVDSDFTIRAPPRRGE